MGRPWHLSVVWQQQVARHEVIDFSQNARNGPARTTRHTDVDGPGAMPHAVMCVLLWPVDGFTPTLCLSYFFSQSASYF
jgi:hypothetical protein